MQHLPFFHRTALSFTPRRASLTVLLVPFILFVSWRASALGMDLVKDGKVRATIVVADQPSETARFASQELKWHLEKATGDKVTVLKESEAVSKDTPKIYVGACLAAIASGIDAEGLAADEALLKVEGNSLFLIGKEGEGDPLDIKNPDVGTLFAVYELLEELFGVRWLWPGELGAHVPPKQQVAVHRNLNRSSAPRVPHRHVWSPGISSLYRKESNENYKRDLKVFMRRHRLGWSDVIEDPAHSFSTWWKTFGEAHPSWFALDAEGKRDGTKGMDVANPELHQYIVNGIEEHSKEGVKRPVFVRNRGQNWFRLGEIDLEWKPSLSPESLAWDGPLQDNKHAAALYESFGQHHASDRYARFYQTIYDLASSRDPNVKVAGFLYWTYLMAPTKPIKISPKVYGNFAPWGYIDTGTVFFPLKEEDLNWVKTQWEGWHATGMSMVYRPNHWHGSYVMPHLERQGAEFFKWAFEHGMVGFKFDRLMDHWAIRGPTLYLYFRLFADPSLEIDAIMEEYYSGFGPAANAIRKYVKYWEDYALLRHTGAKLPPGIMTGKSFKTGSGIEPLVPNPLINPAGTALVFPPDVFTPAEQILDEAKEAAKSDLTGTASQRVNFLRIGLDHARLTSEFWASMEIIDAGKARLPDDPQKREQAKETFRRLEDFRFQYGDSNAVNFGEAALYYEVKNKDIVELRKQYQKQKN